jgi:hypothetical protein
VSYAYDLEYIRRDRELESARILGFSSEQLVTAPTEEPVTVDEVKRHLRIAVDDENELIDRYIRAHARKRSSACVPDANVGRGDR